MPYPQSLEYEQHQIDDERGQQVIERYGFGVKESNHQDSRQVVCNCESG